MDRLQSGLLGLIVGITLGMFFMAHVLTYKLLCLESGASVEYCENI